jgi:Rrf2 family protein
MAALKIAMGYEKEPVRIKSILEGEDVSIQYLKELVAMLKTAGLVHGITSPKVGYVLAKPASEISFKDVYFAIEGPMFPEVCCEHPEYVPDCAGCMMSQFWREFQGTVMETLETITLTDLIDGSS